MAPVLPAFEHKSQGSKYVETFSTRQNNNEVEELAQITQQNTPPPPPAPPAPSIELHIVDNTALVMMIYRLMPNRMKIHRLMNTELLLQ